MPKILEWNFEVQQELSTNMVLTAAYIASHGSNLLFPVDINQVPEQYLSPDDATGPTNKRPYPLFQGINNGPQSGGTNNGVSNYNPLQTKLNASRSVAPGCSRSVGVPGNFFCGSEDGVIIGTIPVARPLPYVACYVIKAISVRREFPAWI